MKWQVPGHKPFGRLTIRPDMGDRQMDAHGNRSAWTGENSWRPLPEREHSVRDDYGVMEGFHRIVITPGWIHGKIIGG